MRYFSWNFGPVVAVAALAVAAGCKHRDSGSDAHAEARRLFDSACATCHGRDGRGGVPAAEGLPPPRNFRDAAFQASRTDAELKQVIVTGQGPMPPFGKLFDEAQLALLVAHIRDFNPKK
jgi:mono/diheme cytochrome c family protein